MKIKEKKLIILFFIIVILLYGNISPINIHAQKKPAAPKITLLKTVHNCRTFKNIQIHPTRYILSTGYNGNEFFPAIYDIQKNELIQIPPIDKIPGIPIPIKITARSNEYTYKKSELILAGKFWDWYGEKLLIYYNPEKNRAGFFMDSYKIIKHIQGNPPCPGNEPSTLVEQYHRYYCQKSRKYIDEKDYTNTMYTQYYAEMDLSKGSILSITPLERNWDNPMEQDGVYPIGVNPEGTYFYYCNKIFFYKKNQSPGHIIIHRFNIAEKKVDKKYIFNIPVRHKDTSLLGYSIQYFASSDLNKIVFWEYDESASKDPSVGFLKNPTAQAYVVDTNSWTHMAVNIPVTAYGQLIDHDKRYLLIGSNQTGFLHRYDLKTGKEDLKINVSKNIFKLILSANSKYLYILTKRSIFVYSWPELKKIKTIPLNQIFPGVDQLLVSETVYSTGDGKFAVIGILKKGPHGPWASSDLEDGFHLLSIGE